jgi:hypothetical protein
MAHDKNKVAETKKVEEPKRTEQEIPAVVDESIYSIDEIAAVPTAVGSNSPDIVRAALKLGGRENYSIEQAKALVNNFSKKEV